MTINYSKQVLLKRGNTAVSSTYVGPLGEVTVDTDFATIRVHDGVTPGGHLSTSSASGATPPSNPRESSIWYDTVGGRLYVYYDGAWVDASPSGDLFLAANVANLSVLVTGLTSDVANVETHIDSLDANIGAFETAVNVTVGTLNANINSLNQTIAAFESNAGPTSDAWVDDAPPDISNVGALWYDDVSGRLYVYYAGAWVDANPPITTGFGNVLPSANVTYSLGSEQYQWKDLWVSSNTIYIGNTPITVSNGSLSVGNSVVSGGGGTYGNANVAAYLSNYPGQMVFTSSVANISGLDIIRSNEYQFANGVSILNGLGGGNPFNQNLNTTDAATFANVSATIGFISQINGTNPGGELVIQTNGTHNWIFDANGTTTFPGGGHIGPSGGKGQGTTYGAANDHLVSLTSYYDSGLYSSCVTAYADGTLNITAYNDGGPNPAKIWTFDNTGNLTLPAGGDILDSNGASVLGGGGTDTGDITFDGYNIGSTANVVNITASDYAQLESGNVYIWAESGADGAGAAYIQVGSGIFEFNNVGDSPKLKLPAGADIVNDAGESVLGGGGAADTGNIVFSGSSIGLDEGSAEAADTYINISPNGEGWAYLQLPNDTSANITDTRLWNAAGNVEIGTGDFSNLGESYTWNFNKDGSLTFPGGNITIASNIIGSGTDAMLGSANVIIAVIAQGESGSVGLQWSDTGVDVGLGSNVAAVALNSPGGSTPGTVQIQTGVIGGSLYTWEFGADGVTTFPNSGVINTSGNSVDIGSDDAISLEANAAVNIYTDTNDNTYQWQFGNDGTTTFPGNILVPGNLSTIAGFAFYNGDPISIVATAPIFSIRFIQPYHIEIAKTGLPAGFDTLLGSSTWTATANGLTLTVVSVVSNGDYWRITVAENPNGTISTIATFNRAASGANIVIPAGGSITFANGVNILSTVGAGAYGNAQVASYLLQFDGDIEFTSSTARIGNVDVVTVGDHIRSPVYQFSNGVNILSTVGAGSYGNTEVAAYLTTYGGNIALGNASVTGNLTVNGNIAMVSNVARYTWVASTAPTSGQGSVGDIWYQTF